MKAAYFERHGGPEVIRYGDLPDPEAGQWHFVSRQFRRQFFTVAQAVDSRPVQPFSPQAQSNG